MNGMHDLGGMHGMGPVNPEPQEPVFHAPWVHAMESLLVQRGALTLGEIDARMAQLAKEAA